MKRFVNLPQNYKLFLDEFKTILNKTLVENILKNELSYQEVLKFHNYIDSIAEKYNCNSYDINKLINFYDKDNKLVDLLKKISSLRNKLIVVKSQKTDLWKNNIDNLKNKFKKYNKTNIEQAFVKLLKKYKYDWNGLWTIFR
jgi:LPS sulfotransferase NodH